jgi:hypothetical protein
MIRNYPGFSQGISGARLAQETWQQAKHRIPSRSRRSLRFVLLSEFWHGTAGTDPPADGRVLISQASRPHPGALATPGLTRGSRS